MQGKRKRAKCTVGVGKKEMKVWRFHFRASWNGVWSSSSFCNNCNLIFSFALNFLRRQMYEPTLNYTPHFLLLSNQDSQQDTGRKEGWGSACFPLPLSSVTSKIKMSFICFLLFFPPLKGSNYLWMNKLCDWF